MSIRQLLLPVATVSLLGLPACGGTSSGYLKVDSPLIPFEAPEEDELLEDVDDGAATAPADQDSHAADTVEDDDV